MKKFITLFAFLIFTGISFNIHAQLSGQFSIPGAPFPTIAAAIDSLNKVGVDPGGVIFNVAAGHTETSSNLTISVTGNGPIEFIKTGAGANPLITAAPGLSGSSDGIIKLSGTDYVTFDGIDLVDPASNTGNAMMEWGYALMRASPTDGSQHNVIKNCNITLQKSNTLSIGIHIVNRDTSGIIVVATDTAGQNSYNRLFGNTISNVYRGIVVISPTTTRDIDNEIGVQGLASNSITNWGGANVASEGIRCEGQINIKINNNIVNGGTGTTQGVYGILATLFGGGVLNSAPNYEISYNQVTVTPSVSSSATYGIRALANGDIVKIHHNIVENCIATQNTAGFNALVHDPVGDVNASYIYNNIIRNNSHSGTGASTLLSGAGSDTIDYLSIHSNQVYGNQKTGISGTMNCIAASNGIIDCDSNMVYNNSIPNSSGTGTSTVYGYINNGDPIKENVFNNTMYNLSVGGANTSTSSLIAGIRSNVNASTTKFIYGNQIYGLSGVCGASTTGGVYGIYSTLSAVAKIYRNKIYDLSNTRANGTSAGCWISSGLGIEIYENLISDIKAPNSTNANGVIGINSTSTTANSTIKIFGNNIYLTASGGTTFGSSGISVAANATATTASVDMQNNEIINLSAPGTTSGSTVAYRRSGVSLSNYALTSDFNNFYAGTPAANRLIFFDGTNSDQMLVPYQNRVAPRDSHSVSALLKTLNLAINLEACEQTDTILVEVRNSVSPFGLVDSAIGLGGLGIKHVFTFENLTDGMNYYIVVKHRNSIETWSKSGGENFNTGILNYDFTSSASQAYENNQVLVGSDYSFYTGDVNQDGLVDLSDIVDISNDANAFVTGYVVTDLDCNMIVDLTDAVFAFNNSSLFVNVKKP